MPGGPREGSPHLLLKCQGGFAEKVWHLYLVLNKRFQANKFKGLAGRCWPWERCLRKVGLGEGGWLVAEFRKNRDNVSVFCSGRHEPQGWPESSRKLGVHKRHRNQALRKHRSMLATEFWRNLSFFLILILISGRGSKHLFMHPPNPKLLSWVLG